MGKKLRKGASQDALGGLNMPEAAGIFAATGTQGISAATLGLKPVGNLGPINSNPGVSALLNGGESPFVIPAEGGIDMTRKAIKRAVRRAVKKAGNSGNVTVDQLVDAITATCAASDVQSVGAPPQAKYLAKQLKKVRQDPVKALARLEMLSGRLRPNDGRRLAAASVVLKAKLIANDAAASGGSVKKAVDAIDTVEVFAALSDVEQALGLTSSAAGFSPAAIAADSQMRRIVGGGRPESLRGRQNVAAAAVGGPAAVLGQALKSGLGAEIHQAEQAVQKAEASGRVEALQQAEGDLTALRLKAEALTTFGPVGPFGGR